MQPCAFPGHDPARIQPVADYIVDLFRQMGIPEIELLNDYAPQPAILAQDCRAGADQPTVLCYAHYDVQPPLDAAGWQSPPDQADLRNGRLYGRGSADDLAGVVCIAAAYDAWQGQPPCNLKILIEGQEEIGSPT